MCECFFSLSLSLSLSLSHFHYLSFSLIYVSFVSHHWVNILSFFLTFYGKINDNVIPTTTTVDLLKSNSDDVVCCLYTFFLIIWFLTYLFFSSSFSIWPEALSHSFIHSFGVKKMKIILFKIYFLPSMTSTAIISTMGLFFLLSFRCFSSFSLCLSLYVICLHNQSFAISSIRLPEDVTFFPPSKIITSEYLCAERERRRKWKWKWQKKTTTLTRRKKKSEKKIFVFFLGESEMRNSEKNKVAKAKKFYEIFFPLSKYTCVENENEKINLPRSFINLVVLFFDFLFLSLCVSAYMEGGIFFHQHPFLIKQFYHQMMRRGMIIFIFIFRRQCTWPYHFFLLLKKHLTGMFVHLNNQTK